MSVRTLFLHGGPGLHAGVERRWFGDTLAFHWWDQPSAKAGDAAPFACVVAAAAGELSALYAKEEHPIRLVAHSFGALVARMLAREMPDLIHTLTLLAPTRNVHSALQRLAASLPQLSIGARTHGFGLNPPERLPSPQQFHALIEKLLTVENLFDCYWGRAAGSERDRYKRLSQDLPAFDLETFLAVAYDSLRESERRYATACELPTRIVVGSGIRIRCSTRGSCLPGGPSFRIWMLRRSNADTGFILN